MKLYHYSGALLTFVEAKWALAKLVSGGVLVGTVLLFGVLRMNQSVENILAPRSANILASENDILRQQISMITPRLSKLELHAEQLRERANDLHELLKHLKPVRNKVISFTNGIDEPRPQPLTVAAKSPRP